MARDGAKVVINDLGCEVDGTGTDERVALQVAEEIRAHGGEAELSVHDVAKAGGAKAAVQTAIETFGALHVLVNSVGVISDKTLVKMEETSWDCVVGTVLKSAFLCTQAASRQMIAQGDGGHIVNLTGLPGYLGNFGQANFAAACAGIHGLTRTAAIELQKHKITVNAVAPLAKTRLTEALPVLQGFDNVTVEHVVPAVLMLASDLCGERTGYVLAVAGARVYSYKFVESPGKFKDESAGLFTPAEIAEHWTAITKA